MHTYKWLNINVCLCMYINIKMYSFNYDSLWITYYAFQNLAEAFIWLATCSNLISSFRIIWISVFYLVVRGLKSLFDHYQKHLKESHHFLDLQWALQGPVQLLWPWLLSSWCPFPSYTGLHQSQHRTQSKTLLFLLLRHKGKKTWMHEWTGQCIT